MKTAYSERDYTYGTVMLTLRTAIGLTQEELAKHLGISRQAVGKWEAGSMYPKAEHLKEMIALAVQHQAFPKGSEDSEIRALWKVARQKVLLDEHWLSTLLQGQAQEPHVASAPVPETTNHTPATVLPAPETKEKSDNTPATSLLHEHQDARTPKTTRRHKRLVVIVITLAILAITGVGGILLVLARDHATPQAYPGYLTGKGTLAFFDPLSQEGKWKPLHNAYGGACEFKGGAYHVSQQPNGYFAWCRAGGISSNFAFEVQFTITQGGCGGMAFRADSDGQHFYIYAICQDGVYTVSKYISRSGGTSTMLQGSKSSAIRTGLGQQNKIAVVASGSTMTFYVNEQPIDQLQDSSYSSGWIALVAAAQYNHATDVAYSNAKLWVL
jgi:transcriptional regulator with XRE-family HTH domain